jgi:hypothetical protein
MVNEQYGGQLQMEGHRLHENEYGAIQQMNTDVRRGGVARQNERGFLARANWPGFSFFRFTRILVLKRVERAGTLFYRLGFVVVVVVVVVVVGLLSQYSD